MSAQHPETDPQQQAPVAETDAGDTTTTTPEPQAVGESAGEPLAKPAEDAGTEDQEKPVDDAGTGTTPAPAAPRPTPKPAPKPGAVPKPSMLPRRPGGPAAPTPAGAAPAAPSTPASPATPVLDGGAEAPLDTEEVAAAAAFGRVDDDGTVHVLESGGERVVGQYPRVSAHEAQAQ